MKLYPNSTPHFVILQPNILKIYDMYNKKKFFILFQIIFSTDNQSIWKKYFEFINPITNIQKIFFLPYFQVDV